MKRQSKTKNKERVVQKDGIHLKNPESGFAWFDIYKMPGFLGVSGLSACPSHSL